MSRAFCLVGLTRDWTSRSLSTALAPQLIHGVFRWPCATMMAISFLNGCVVSMALGVRVLRAEGVPHLVCFLVLTTDVSRLHGRGQRFFQWHGFSFFFFFILCVSCIWIAFDAGLMAGMVDL